MSAAETAVGERARCYFSVFNSLTWLFGPYLPHFWVSSVLGTVLCVDRSLVLFVVCCCFCCSGGSSVRVLGLVKLRKSSLSGVEVEEAFRHLRATCPLIYPDIYRTCPHVCGHVCGGGSWLFRFSVKGFTCTSSPRVFRPTVSFPCSCRSPKAKGAHTSYTPTKHIFDRPLSCISLGQPRCLFWCIAVAVSMFRCTCVFCSFFCRDSAFAAWAAVALRTVLTS